MMAPMIQKVGAAAAGAVLYFVMAWVSLEWRGDLKPSLLWLATGAITTLALAIGPTLWWWVIAGGAVGGLVAGPVLFDDNYPELLGPVAGNTLESVLIVLALPLALGPSLRIRRTIHGLWVILIIIGATSVGGLLALTGDSAVMFEESAHAWFRWTIGNSVGEALLVPLVLFQGTAIVTHSRRGVPAEMLLTFGLIVLVATAAIIVDSPLLYVVIPMVLWVAVRFGPAVAAPVATVTIVAVWAATAQGHGPFVEFDGDPALQAELYTLTMATCVIVGGAQSVRAWNDNRRLAAVITAIPDILFIRRRDDRSLLTSWIPSGGETLATTIEPSATDVSATIRNDPPAPADTALLDLDNGVVLERRSVHVDDERDLDLYRDLSIEQRALRELRLRREAVEDARWAERKRLGQALHDSPVQLLAAALLRLETARNGGADDPENLDKVRELAEQAMNELRQKLHDLIPPDVAGGAVVEALGHLARQLLDGDVEIVLDSAVSDAPAPEVCEMLFLIGREAISNVALHAHADRVEVRLTDRDGAIALYVADDGTGSTSTQTFRRGLGIELMHERAREFDGSVLVEGGSDGTTVTISLPRSGRPSSDERA